MVKVMFWGINKLEIQIFIKFCEALILNSKAQDMSKQSCNTPTFICKTYKCFVYSRETILIFPMLLITNLSKCFPHIVGKQQHK